MEKVPERCAKTKLKKIFCNCFATVMVTVHFAAHFHGKNCKKIFLFLLGFVPNKHVHIHVVDLICRPQNLCGITVLLNYVGTHFTYMKKWMLLRSRSYIDSFFQLNFVFIFMKGTSLPGTKDFKSNSTISVL